MQDSTFKSDFIFDSIVRVKYNMLKRISHALHRGRNTISKNLKLLFKNVLKIYVHTM